MDATHWISSQSLTSPIVFVCVCVRRMIGEFVNKFLILFFLLHAPAPSTNTIIASNTHFNWNDKTPIPNDMIYDWNQWILVIDAFFFCAASSFQSFVRHFIDSDVDASSGQSVRLSHHIHLVNFVWKETQSVWWKSFKLFNLSGSYQRQISAISRSPLLASNIRWVYLSLSVGITR